ncbi:uncharacterized protein LOC111064795 isoform X2 [Drosophila obscura]|uniref:uncharacterized protein LOC111064795 isoform X2 n=1 Tax=Drosophila obscura TaxID=7282 RepID=UPI001BB2A1F6|nr:uncharacterized protein LOC111064795 isoform X2 [Drosophila obscura]
MTTLGLWLILPANAKHLRQVKWKLLNSSTIELCGICCSKMDDPVPPPTKKIKIDHSKNIFDLPLNIVNVIFKKLCDNDKQKFAKVHPLYRTAVADQSVKPLTDIFPLFATSIVLSRFVKESQQCATILLSRVEHICPHIIAMEVNADDSDLEIVELVLTRMKRLRSLDLNIIGEDIEKFTRMLHKLPNLEELRLYSKDKVKEYPKTKKEIDIYQICLPMKKLRLFGAYGFCINPTQVVELACPHLRTLIMVACDIIAELPHIPHLSGMILNYNTFSPNVRFYEWISKYGKALKKLMLYRYNPRVETIPTNKMFKCCNKLKFIRLDTFTREEEFMKN